MDLSIYRLLNVVDNESEVGESVYLDEKSIEQIIRDLRSLASDITEIGDRCRVVSRDGISEFFYFDFDVLFSAINWLTSPRSLDGHHFGDGLWSSLAVVLFRKDTYVLPATLFELWRFLEKRREVMAQLSNSTMSSAFVEGFFSTNSPREQVEPYLDSVSALRNVNFNENTLYVLSRLFREMPNLKAVVSRLNYDPDTFQETFHLLGVGYRKSKPINNRVDALNFSVLTKTNIDYENEHHSLISTSPALSALYGANKSIYRPELISHGAGNPVLSPRRACLYRLINADGVNAINAEDFSRELRNSVQRLISQCEGYQRKIRNDGAIDRSEVLNSDAMVDLVWMLDGLRGEIEARRRAHESSFDAFRRTYSQSDQKQFLIDLQGRISHDLQSSKYKEFLMSENVANGLSIEKFFASASGGNENSVSAYELFDGDTAVNVLVEDGAIRLWTPAKIDVRDFVNSIVATNSRLVNKFCSDEYAFNKVSPSTDKFFEGGMLLFFLKGQVSRHEFDISSRINTNRLVDRVLEEAGSDGVAFVKFVHPLYSSSYDGRLLAARTEFSIAEDVKFLFDTALREQTNIFRHSDAKRAIEGYAKSAHLAQLDLAN